MPFAYVDGLSPVATGHRVARDALVPALRCGDQEKTLWLCHDTVIQGPILHAGAVVAQGGARFWSGIQGGHEVVLGAGCHVKGSIHAIGRIVLQHGCIIQGSVQAGGDILILGDCQVGNLTAGGDIIVVGAPKTGRMEPGGRVLTRPF